MQNKLVNALALGALLVPAAWAADNDPNNTQLQQVPEPVRMSLLREAADGGRIKSVEQDVKDGQQFYRAKIETVDGKWMVKVSPEGAIFETDKKELEWSKAPTAVQGALLNQAKGGKVVRLDRKVDAGQNTYVAIVEREGKLERVYFSEAGQRLKEDRPEMEREVKEGMSRIEQGVQQQSDQLQQVPDPVRNTVKREVGADGKIKDVKLDKVDGRTVYNIAIERDGRTKNLRVREDGEVVQ
jgi:uncharacterized membrane protein YkoI